MQASKVKPEVSSPITDHRPVCAIVLVLGLMVWQCFQSMLLDKPVNERQSAFLVENHDKLLYLEPHAFATPVTTVSPDKSPLFFQPVPINRASQQLLQSIPGIGPGIAAKIVQWRETHGLFHSPEDLLAIPGIGRKRVDVWAEQFSFVSSE